MDKSILVTIKKLLGLEADYDAFDPDIVALINSAFLVLKQLGVGPAKGFAITGPEETFDEFLSDPSELNMVAHYLYLKVRSTWDTSSMSSHVLTSVQDQIKELEFRLAVDVETDCLEKESSK